MWHFIASISASALILYLSGQLYRLFGGLCQARPRRRAVGAIAVGLVCLASVHLFYRWALLLLGLAAFLLSVCYDISWPRRVLGFALVLVLAVVAHWLSARLLMAGFGVTAARYAGMTGENRLLFWAERIWAGFFALLVVRLPGLSRERRKVFETRQLPALSLAFPAASCFVVFAMANTAKAQSDIQAGLFFLLYWLLFFANVFLIDLMERVTVARLTEREQELARLALEQESARYQQVLRQHSEIARRTHDVRNQLCVAVELLREGQVEQAQRLVEKSITAAGGTAGGRVSGNAAIDAVLDTKRGQMEELSIALFADIVMPETCAVSYEDLAVLTGGLMDNAITACADVPSEQARYIDLVLRQIQDYLCVQIKHPVCESNHVSCEQQDADAQAIMHGFSVGSIRLVAEKYSGNVKLQQEADGFTATVLLTNLMPGA